MGGRFIHLYGAKVELAGCVRQTDTASHPHRCKSQWPGMLTWRTCLGAWFTRLSIITAPGSPQDTQAESARSTGRGTIYWAHHSYCRAKKTVHQRMSTVPRTQAWSV